VLDGAGNQVMTNVVFRPVFECRKFLRSNALFCTVGDLRWNESLRMVRVRK